MKITDERLIEMALEAREKAYAPYSNFLVGAAVLWESGNIYTGCNVENSSFGATNCAERTAIFSAVAAGETKKNKKILKVAIVGGKFAENLDFCAPCGICLQVISEFAKNGSETKILLAKTKLVDGKQKIEKLKEFSLNELLPIGFELQAD